MLAGKPSHSVASMPWRRTRLNPRDRCRALGGEARENRGRQRDREHAERELVEELRHRAARVAPAPSGNGPRGRTNVKWVIGCPSASTPCIRA